MACGPAMNEAELYSALGVGVDLARSAAEQGRTLVGTGEMGIGNTTADEEEALVEYLQFLRSRKK